MNSVQKIITLASIIVLSSTSYGDEFRASATWVNNYKNWGWEKALILDNGLIHLSIIPEVGARILEYDLDGHPSLHITRDELGKVYEYSDHVKSASDWKNYGGYRVALLPTDKTSVGGNRFPPPVMIGTGRYEAEVLENTPEQSTIRVRSGTQDLPVPKWNGKQQAFQEALEPESQIQMERTMTIYQNSSRVRIVQSLINVGDIPVSWGFKGISQSTVRQGDKNAYEDFWCYFPINPRSFFGYPGVAYKSAGFWAATRNGRISKDDIQAKQRFEAGPMPHLKGEVVPGVFGGQFGGDDMSGIFADPHIGWMAYVDEADGYLYAKVFEVSDDWVYGNDSKGDSVRVSVYNSTVFGDGRQYMEMEVMAPIREMESRGGRNTFVEDWYAAKVHGPIHHVNHQGAIARRLELNHKAAGLVTGEYGVFHIGYAQAVLLDSDGNTIASAKKISTTPTATLRYRDYFQSIPFNARRVELRIYRPEGIFIGLLDALNISQ